MHMRMFLCSVAWISLEILQLTLALTKNVQKGQSEVLACPSGSSLDISSAQYNARTVFCKQKDVTDILQDQCQNSRTCTVYARDRYYNYSCFFKRRSTLTVIYYCQVNGISSLTTETFVSTTLSLTNTDNTDKLNDSSLAWESTTFGDYTDGVRTEKVIDNVNDEQSIPLVPIIGCMFALFFVGLVAVILFRRFRKSKAIVDENVDVLQIVPLTQITHEGSPTRSFENNYYHIEPCGVPLSTELTGVNSLHDTTSLENPEYSEYSFIEEHLTDSLPPSYLIATANSSQIKDENSVYSSVNRYIQKDLHSECLATDSSKDAETKNVQRKPKKDNGNGCINTVGKKGVSGDLSLQKYNQRNIYCNTFMDRTTIIEPSADDNPRVNLYVNIENVNDKRNTYQNTQDDDVFEKCDDVGDICQKDAKCDDVGDICQKNPKCDDVRDNLQKSAKSDGFDNNNHTYQNVKDEDGCNSCHGYMTMNVGHLQIHSGDVNNVYVPIMSPTELSSQQTFDDTYHL